MEPTLLVGDRLFVTKYTYGYSKHSFPFSPPILSKRIMFSSPERGDVVVFEYPRDNVYKYVKRCIGLPGDKVRINNRTVFVNDKEHLLPDGGQFSSENPTSETQKTQLQKPTSETHRKSTSLLSKHFYFTQPFPPS